MLAEIIFPLLPIASAVLVVVLVELQRRRSPDRGALFEWMLTVFVALLLAALAAVLVYRVSYDWQRDTIEGLCDIAAIRQLVGPYGCSQAHMIAMRIADPFKLLPALLGLAAATCLCWPGWTAVTRRARVLLAGAGLGLLLLPVLLTGGAFLPSLLVGLVPLAWVPLAWVASGSRRWAAPFYGLALAGLIALAWFYLYRHLNLNSVSGGIGVFQMGLMGLLPLSLGLMAARALALAFTPRSGRAEAAGRGGWRAALAWLLLAGLMGAFFAYVLTVESVWDRVLDGMTAMMLPGVVMLGVVAGGMFLAWALPGRRKLAALGFVLAAGVLLYLPQARSAAGIRAQAAEDFNGETGRQITQAVQRYQARNGHYPPDLKALVPRDLLFIQQPVAIRELDWCYQSGADYYRLGYVQRPFIGVPPEYYRLVIISQQGDLPDTPWDCDQELARQQAQAQQMMDRIQQQP